MTVYTRIQHILLGCLALFFAGAASTQAQTFGNGSVTIGGSSFGPELTASGQYRAITTAVPFLMICPDARSGGMAEAGVAVAEGANALYWNPSLLAFTEKKLGFAVNYTPWMYSIIPGINHAFVPFYYNFGEKGGVLGASVTFFSLGEIQFTDANATNTGTYNPTEFDISAYYTHIITKEFSMGAALRFIRSDLASVGTSNPIDPGMSFGGDINLLWNKTWDVSGKDLNFKLGMNIKNIGSKMRYGPTAQTDFIPTNLKLGYALKYEFDKYNSLTFVNDFNKLMVPSAGGASDKGLLDGMFTSFGDAEGGPPFSSAFAEEMAEIQISLGLEYWYNNLFAFRTGFFHEDEFKGNRQFMTLGASLRFRVFTLDFAYLTAFTQNHPLQNTIRFSLSFDFGSKTGFAGGS